MKTQILQLEPHDDIISTRDKIGWGHAPRVLVVWPSRGRVLTRRLDLVLLQRHSQALGIQLALVTRDQEVRQHARELGIILFDSVRLAQQARWRQPRRKPKAVDRSTLGRINPPSQPVPARLVLPASSSSRMSPISRLVLFSLGVVAFLSIAAVLLPTAQITMTPIFRQQEITLTVRANPSVDRVYLSGSLPAREINVVVEGRDSLVPSGSAPIPDHTASSQVRFMNLIDRQVSIPAGTVVSAPGSNLRFATQRAGYVPAGSGETILLPVTALEPGSASNLPSGSLQAIEGPLGTSLAVTNPEPATGGSDRRSPAATLRDRNRLFNQLVSSLRNSALVEIKSSLKDGDVLLTLEPSIVRTLEQVYEPSGDQPTNLLSLTLRLQVQALVVSGDDLKSLAISVLNANLPDGYTPVNQSLEIEHASSPALEPDNTTRWRIHARRQLRAQLPANQAVALSLGLSPAEASQRLADQLPISGPPRITLNPPWWPRLPVIPFRIQVHESAQG